MGVEPTYAAWEAAVLPMNYSRGSGWYYSRLFSKMQDEKCRIWFWPCPTANAPAMPEILGDVPVGIGQTVLRETGHCDVRRMLRAERAFLSMPPLKQRTQGHPAGAGKPARCFRAAVRRSVMNVPLFSYTLPMMQRGITMKKFLAVLCALIVLGTSARALEISAPSALLMEKETGTILFSKDEHAKLEPASVTKVMTLLLTMEAIDSGQLSYDTVITASAHACSMGGSQIWLKENEQMTVSDMLKAVCVVSANDCAVALAEQVAGSEEAFVEQMNLRARELGMNDTTFKNATGLPAAGHVTSAHDIALMSRELILNHPDIRQYTTIWMDTLRGGESQLVNTNKLIRFYDGATGLKTGSTDNALYCLSGTAERDGMELIAAIMKAPTSAQRFEDAKTLLGYGFSTYALKKIVPEEALPPVPVQLGTQATVQPVLGEGSALLLEKSKAAALAQSVSLAESAAAPVAAGDQLGTLTVTAGEEVVAEIPILAGETVPRITFGQMFFRLLRTAFLAG